VIATDGQGLRFLDTATGRTTRFVGRDHGFSGGGWNPRGDRFATVTGGLVQVWDPHTAALVAENRGSLTGRLGDLDYSPDGSRIVVVDLGGRATMLDSATLEPVGKPVHIDEALCCVQATRDDHTAFVILGGPPSSVMDSFEFVYPRHAWALVDFESGVVVKRGEAEIEVDRTALSPDGRHLAVGGDRGEVLEMDMYTGKPLRTPVATVHSKSVRAIAWSTGGTRFVTASDDGSVGLWNGASGEPIGSVVVPGRLPTSVELLENGRTVLVATYTDGIYLWDTRMEHAVAFACKVAGRNLTAREWQDQFGNRPYLQACPAQ
jgi:WD40 repeat protein